MNNTWLDFSVNRPKTILVIGFMLITAPKSGNVFTLETLSLVHEMTEDAEQTPLSIRVDSLTNFQHTWAEGDDMIVEDLVYELADLNQQRLDYIRTVSFNEPNLVNRIISPKGDITVINVSVNINKPQTLQKIEAFSQWLRTQPEINHVSTITDTFKRLSKNMHGDDPNYYVLPDDREPAAQYLLLYEMSLPYGLGLTNQLDMNKSATRVTAMLKETGSKELTGPEIKAQEWFSTNAPNLKLTAASPGLMFAYIGETNMASMLKGNIVALILISGLLVFALKSFKIGMISLL